MAVKFTNNAKTTLASGINSSVTTATVTDGSVFPTLGSGEHFYCTFDDGTNNEIVKVTARSGNTLTIVRGVDNTTARSFSASDAAELRATSALLTDIQENIAAKSANQTVYNTTTASSATDYDIGIDPSVEANAMVFLNGVMQHHDTFSFSGSTLTFDTAPPDGMALEVIVDNLINLQSSNLTVDTFTAADVSGSPQTDFTLSDAPAAEDNLLVFIDGVFQDQDAYTISNQTLTITDGVTADFGVTVYVINPVNIGTPSDGTVTSSKLSGNITMPADLTVTGDVAFDSPTFVVDNANSRVGIGTASPSTLLDIVGDVKMSANLTVDTDTLHVDATNNRVGIGTASPSSVLEVTGTGDADTGILTTHSRSGVGYTLRLNNTNNGANKGSGIKWSSGGFDTGAIIIRSDATAASGDAPAYMTFHTSADGTESINERMRIDSTGNVGIRKTNPAFSLDIESADDGLARFTSTDANAYITLGDSGSSSAFNRIGVTTHDMWFNTNNAEAMRIDSSGNLLVGTTDNVAHVTSSSGEGIALSAGSYGGFIGATRNQDVVMQLNRTGNDGDIVRFAKDGSTVGSIAAKDGDMALGTGDTSLRFIDGSDAITPHNTSTNAGRDNAIDLGSSGARFKDLYLSSKVNLGDTNRNLMYRSANNDLLLEAASGLFYRQDIGNTNHSWFVGNSERMRIDSSGNVGIGVSSPIGVLTVDYGTTTQGGGVSFRRNSTQRWDFYANSGGNALYSEGNHGYFGTSSAHNVVFVTNETERMRINSSGQLLIGQTAAVGSETVLQVSGSDRSGGVVGFYDTDATTSIGNIILRLAFTNDNDCTNASFIHFADGDGTIGSVYANNASSVVFSTVSDERLKENIVDASSQLQLVKDIKVREFDWKKDGTHQVGFIAQELNNLVPEAVAEGGEDVKENAWGVDYGKLTPYLVKAIQEQQEQIETLKQEIREIKESG